MNAAHHAVVIAGVRRLLAKNPDGSYGPHFIEPEKAPRPPTPVPVIQGRVVGDEAKREKAHRVAGDVLREVAVIAKGSKDAATVYSYNGATHRKTQLALRFVITETLEVWQHISEIVDRVDRIGTAVAALERRKSLFYAGVWEAGESYQEGDFVTDRGSLWHANRATSARPGDGSGAWTLAVKRGKDAK